MIVFPVNETPVVGNKLNFSFASTILSTKKDPIKFFYRMRIKDMQITTHTARLFSNHCLAAWIDKTITPNIPSLK